MLICFEIDEWSGEAEVYEVQLQIIKLTPIFD